MKCQIGISKILNAERTDGRGGRRTLPYVFTEQGISMLASVLHSEVAVNVSIGIMRAFVEMRRFIANNALLFERISNVELKQLEYQKQTDEKLEQIYVTLDDPDVRYLAKHDPALLKSIGAGFSPGCDCICSNISFILASRDGDVQKMKEIKTVFPVPNLFLFRSRTIIT